MVEDGITMEVCELGEGVENSEKNRDTPTTGPSLRGPKKRRKETREHRGHSWVAQRSKKRKSMEGRGGVG